jgi:hypothetical protein
MALQISADVIRALIPDGVYHLQVLEQRETQRVVVTLTLPSRGGGYTLQIETTEAHIAALFQHLLTTAPPARPPRKRSRTVQQHAPQAGKTPEQPLATDTPADVDGAMALPRRTRRPRRPARVRTTG